MIGAETCSSIQAMQMILLGTPISAEDARAAGLVADIFEPGSVLDNVVQTASKLASMSGTALSLAKEAVCRCKLSSVSTDSSSTMPLRLTRTKPVDTLAAADDLGRDDEFERSLYYYAFGTADKREGVGAFLEKRIPTWSR